MKTSAFKRIFAAFLAVVMLAGLAACGGPEPAPSLTVPTVPTDTLPPC